MSEQDASPLHIAVKHDRALMDSTLGTLDLGVTTLPANQATDAWYKVRSSISSFMQQLKPDEKKIPDAGEIRLQMLLSLPVLTNFLMVVKQQYFSWGDFT